MLIKYIYEYDTTGNKLYEKYAQYISRKYDIFMKENCNCHPTQSLFSQRIHTWEILIQKTEFICFPSYELFFSHFSYFLTPYLNSVPLP